LKELTEVRGELTLESSPTSAPNVFPSLQEDNHRIMSPADPSSSSQLSPIHKRAGNGSSSNQMHRSMTPAHHSDIAVFSLPFFSNLSPDQQFQYLMKQQEQDAKTKRHEQEEKTKRHAKEQEEITKRHVHERKFKVHQQVANSATVFLDSKTKNVGRIVAVRTTLLNYFNPHRLPSYHDYYEQPPNYREL
jgi:hypothetical protein